MPEDFMGDLVQFGAAFCRRGARSGASPAVPISGWSRLKIEPCLKPSLQHSCVPEDPHVVGRESDTQKFDWLDFLSRFEPILNVNVCGP